jgi:hypothetical protein
VAFYIAALFLGTLLGSFITESLFENPGNSRDQASLRSMIRIITI